MKEKLKKLKDFVLRSSLGRLSLAALIIIAGTGVYISETSAYLKTGDEIVNSFNFPTIEPSIVQTSENGNEVTQVKIENTGNVKAYVRCRVLINWISPEGRYYGTEPLEGHVFYIIDSNTQDWLYNAATETFYYKNPVDPAGGKNPVTTDLIFSCRRSDVKGPEGYTLSVDVITETIQAEPGRAVKEAWGVQLNGHTIVG